MFGRYVMLKCTGCSDIGLFIFVVGRYDGGLVQLFSYETRVPGVDLYTVLMSCCCFISLVFYFLSN
jgi:hypothetical protein